jgi:acetolactate synthase-1/2/3 large subunit
VTGLGRPNNQSPGYLAKLLEKEETKMKKTGAEILWECMLREGVEVAFGYPGGAIMPVHDAMLKYPIHHVLTRHEQGAAHAADGYARASGKVGVALATSGPGATNLVTGIATAMLDSAPIVCITGQVSSHLIGGDAFQEVDMTGITLPITKHNYLITNVAEIPQVVREAFHIARSGRPGPVLIDICKDAQIATMDFEYPEDISLPGYQPPRRAPQADLEEAVKLIESAERPVILAGHGVLMSGAMDAIQDADLLLAFGMRFDDRVTGNLRTYAPRARKIHVEIDPSEVHKNIEVDVALMGDLKAVLTDLIPLVDEYDHDEWMAQIGQWRAETEERSIMAWPDDGKLYTAHAIRDLWQITNGEAIVVTGVGQHQMWAAQYYRFEQPFRLLTSGGAGTMGFGLPAALGAWFAHPDKEIWLIDGDGSFQMTQAELSTAVQEGANIKIARLLS